MAGPGRPAGEGLDQLRSRRITDPTDDGAGSALYSSCSLLRRPDGQALVDVGVASGSLLIPTWPMEGPPLPGITIGHVVTTARMGSTVYPVQLVPGTDHTAVLAVLTIPAG